MIPEFRFQNEQAEARYNTQAQAREHRRDSLAKGHWKEVDNLSRVRQRLQMRGQAEIFDRAVVDDGINPLERIIGSENELQSISFLYQGGRVSRSVGRVVIRSPEGGGYGTGFMISPMLLMTNNHVLPSRSVASNSYVEFNYYEGADGDLSVPFRFNFLPATFFITNRKLDFTIVGVEQRNSQGMEVESLGWNRLIQDSGKAVVAETVNIIQHPNGERLQLALRANKIIDVVEEFLHYTTDTMPGSSGSPVFNDEWQVAALHHAGVPKRDEQGNYYLIDGTIWDGSRANIQLIKWIANEGARISEIVAAVLAKLQGDTQRTAVFRKAFENPPEIGGKPEAIQTDRGGDLGLSVDNGMATWTIPLTVSIGIGRQQLSSQISADDIPSDQSEDEDYDDEHLRKLIERFQALPYYDEPSDVTDRDDYYRGINKSLSRANRFRRLSELLKSTHSKELRYRTAKKEHLYPWIDLRENRKLASIYSGKSFEPLEIMRLDEALETRQKELMQELIRESTDMDEIKEQLDNFEAQNPFNCEHVVCQSWFDKKEPMRGDLHHLFSCESGCNSFRSNIPYFQWHEEEEVIRGDCGRREGQRFEPANGKGVAARATLYFLFRYPGQIGDEARELQKERLDVLLSWHEQFPPDLYEKHRNAAIFKTQGNRNPLIDFPELAHKVDFTLGFGE